MGVHVWQKRSIFLRGIELRTKFYSIFNKRRGRLVEALPLSIGVQPLAAASGAIARPLTVRNHLNGAQGAGINNIFSCMKRSSLVGGGHPCTVLLASARNRSRSPASL